MIQTTHEYRNCGSTDIVKDVHSASGSQQYYFRSCGAYLNLNPNSYKCLKEEKQHILQADRERGSKNATNRIPAVSRNPLSRWLKRGCKAELVADHVEPPEENDVLELDERWNYIRWRSKALALGHAVPTNSADRNLRNQGP